MPGLTGAKPQNLSTTAHPLRKNKMKSNKFRSAQKGIGLFVVLAILALAGLIAAVFTSRGAGSVSQIGDATSSGVAAMVMSQAKIIETGYGIAALNGVTVDAVTMDTSVTTGLFNPSIGAQPTLESLPRAFAGGMTPTTWAVFKMKMPAVGTTAGLDTVATLSGVSQATCLAYAKLSASNATIAVPAVTTALAASADMTAEAAITGQLKGCYAIAGSYVVFHVVNVL